MVSDRGPDPITRWLGDDRPPPKPGRYRREYTDDFLRELNQVLYGPEGLAQSYDGPYARRFEPPPDELRATGVVRGPWSVVRDELRRGYEGSWTADEAIALRENVTLPLVDGGSTEWRYVEDCDCRNCTAHRAELAERRTARDDRVRQRADRDRERYRREWQLAAERLVAELPTPEPVVAAGDVVTFSYDQAWDDESRRAFVGRYVVTRVDAELPTRVRRAFRLATESVLSLSDDVQALRATLRQVVDALADVRVDADALDRWADDGGAVGVVDY